ncbi:hypothetical protein AHF37_06198 [Paragonimus kellicotti]|nr:hypothetical protein AHF37_06198 [Paragonimus kellicotti]
MCNTRPNANNQQRLSSSNDPRQPVAVKLTGRSKQTYCCTVQRPIY